MKFLNSFFLFIILGLSLKYTFADPEPTIYFIISNKLNGTAAFVPLEYIDEKEQYLYFSFDFKFHNEAEPKNKDIAFFLINSNFDLNIPNKEKIEFGFSKNIWHEISSKSELENIDWKSIDNICKKIDYKNYNYYIKIAKKDENMNTLLIRMPNYGKKEGYITAGNIDDLPELNKN